MRCLSSIVHLATLSRFGVVLQLGLVASCSASGPGAATPEPPPADAGPAAVEVPVPADPSGFRSSGALRESRALPTATRLLDGRVLVVGGERDDYSMMASVEIYDPATEAITPAAPMPEPRAHHTATLLASGEVLVVGGGQGSVISIPTGEGVLASAILYDPAKNTWRATGAMHGGHAGHRAVRLTDGRVLVAAGGDRVGYPCAAIYANCMVATSIGSAELYDPASGTFMPTGDLAQPRIAFTLDLLSDGRVVAAGGGAQNQGLTSVEIFEPSAGRWAKGPDLVGQRLYQASGALGASLVIVGGKIANVAPITSTDILDQGASAWRRGAGLDVPRTGAKLVPLPSGHGLLVGGNNQLKNEVLADARLYDPSSDAWTPIAPLSHRRYSHVVVPLDDGSVLVVGGRNDDGTVGALERSLAATSAGGTALTP